MTTNLAIVQPLSVCVCVCVGERVCVRVCAEREGGSVCVCVYICVSVDDRIFMRFCRCVFAHSILELCFIAQL